MAAKKKVKKVAAKAKAKVKKAAARVVAKVSPSRGLSVDAWIAKKMKGEQAVIGRELMSLIKEVAPDATFEIKWGQPVFDASGPVGYFRGSAQHVTFGFWRGQSLKDPAGLLEGEGKLMKHLKIRDLATMPKEQLRSWVRQAIELNRTKGDPTKR